MKGLLFTGIIILTFGVNAQMKVEGIEVIKDKITELNSHVDEVHSIAIQLGRVSKFEIIMADEGFLICVVYLS